MMRITKAKVAWDGLLANLCRAINEWTPQDFQSERQYRDSLAAHIRECAPDARVVCEYRHLGTTTDIYVEWEGFLGSGHVFIELKRDLIRKSEFNRLVGQITDLRPEKHNIIVVLCGKTAPDMLARLKAVCKEWPPSVIAYEPSITIVSKTSNAHC